MVGYRVADAVRELLGFEEREFHERKLCCHAVGFMVNVANRVVTWLLDHGQYEKWVEIYKLVKLSGKPARIAMWNIVLLGTGQWTWA